MNFGRVLLVDNRIAEYVLRLLVRLYDHLIVRSLQQAILEVGSH
jgi:hypothetical protein